MSCDLPESKSSKEELVYRSARRWTYARCTAQDDRGVQCNRESVRFYGIHGDCGTDHGFPARTSVVFRNAPCPCGSGLKAKKCCKGARETQQ